MLNYEIRKITNKIYFLNNYIIYSFWGKYKLKWYMYNYFFVKKIINNFIPDINYFNYDKNYFIQKRIIETDSKEIDVISLFNIISLLHFKSKIYLTDYKNIKTIRHSYFYNNSSSLWDFIIAFLEHIYKKHKSRFNNDRYNRYFKIIYLIKINIAIFEDRYVYFIHWDLAKDNILINKNLDYYLIDFENSGFFDYYYDYIFLYKYNKLNFLKFCKENNIKINFKRLFINIIICDFLDDIYNK